MIVLKSNNKTLTIEFIKDYFDKNIDTIDIKLGYDVNGNHSVSEDYLLKSDILKVHDNFNKLMSSTIDEFEYKGTYIYNDTRIEKHFVFTFKVVKENNQYNISFVIDNEYNDISIQTIVNKEEIESTYKEINDICLLINKY